MEVVGQGFSLPIEVYSLFLPHLMKGWCNHYGLRRSIPSMDARPFTSTQADCRWYQTIFPPSIWVHNASNLFRKCFNIFLFFSSLESIQIKNNLKGTLSYAREHFKLWYKWFVLTVFYCRLAKPIFQGKKFVPELWEIILKLLMGITDQLLNANPPDDQLGHAIQKETVKVFIFDNVNDKRCFLRLGCFLILSMFNYGVL